MIPRFVFLLLVLGLSVRAATYNAVSLSYADVASVLTNASLAHGDVVILPAGTNTWTESAPIVCLKGITIYGQGINSTRIIRSTSTAVMLYFTGSGTNRLDVSNFTLDSANIKCGFGLMGIGSDQTTSRSNLNYRVHNIWFDRVGQRGLVIWGWAQGVTYNCLFKAETNDRPQPYTVYGLLRNGTSRTNADPLGGLTFGTITNLPYIEDCVWDHVYGGDGAADGYADARSVFRYNRMTNASAPFSVHEYEGSRYATQWEFYGNIMVTSNSSGVIASSHLRSGAGVVWSNTIITADYTMARPQPFLDYYAASGTNVFVNYYYPDPPASVSVGGWRRWDANWNFTGTNWASGGSQVGYPPGYPAMDQPGWGDPVTWSETNGLNTFYGCYAWSNTYKDQASSPVNVEWIVRDWNNSTLTNLFGGELPNPQDLIIEDRDFFNYPKPGYTPAPYPHPYRTETRTMTVTGSVTVGGNLNASQ